MPSPPTTPSTPGELIGLVPALLDAHHQHCLIVVTATARRIADVVAVPLPPPHQVEAFAADLTIATVACWEFDHAFLIVVDDIPEPAPNALPHHGLIQALHGEAARDNVTIAHALWTPATRPEAHWRCYSQSSCRGIVTRIADGGIATLALHPAAIATHVHPT